MIRTAWAWGVGLVATLVFGPLAILGGFLGVKRQEYYDWCGRSWSGWLIRGSGCTVRAEGVENIDPSSPQVLVSNHQSWYDVPAISIHLRKTYHFVAKKELEKVFIFGRAWKASGHISIDRSNHQSAVHSLDQAGAQLRAEGSAVVIFAEGTRAPTDALQPFKKGAFVLATHTGVPIVPVAVAGTRRVMPKGRWRVTRGPIIVRFGKPIPTAGLSREEKDALRIKVREEVRRMRDEARAELPPGRLEAVPSPTTTTTTN